jgi:hypothetical protein
MVRKTLIPTVLGLLYDFLSSKNDVNVAPKCSKEKKNLVAVLKVMKKIAGSGSVSQRYGSTTLVTR